jgi:hypothetical protein
MVRLVNVFVVVLAIGCGHTASGVAPDTGSAPDAESVARCTNGHAEKIKFTQQDACANDGSVEFCIPDNDPAVMASVTAISPSVTCAPGGGRARCSETPGLLLCSYRTVVPTECVASHGAMTDDAWTEMCALSGLAQIVEIVPTFFE